MAPIRVNPSKARKVSEELNRTALSTGTRSQEMTTDNGPEFAGKVMEACANNVQLDFIPPGKPTESGCAESFLSLSKDKGNVASIKNAQRAATGWRARDNADLAASLTRLI